MDPETLNKIARLELRARMIVEGFLGGLHKSPFHGVSVEFAQHRQYVPGDDIRHLDWKVLGKSDRLFIKQYEEETNLRVQMVVDASESMRFRSSGVSKYDYASMVAASLSYMILNQSDSVGLTIFDEHVRKILPASNNMAHIRAICHEIEHAALKQKTSLGGVLSGLCTQLTRRSLIILISDMFGPAAEILAGIKRLRHRGHDMIIMQILDRQELTFPFEELTQFIGLEGYPNLLIDPRPLREAYLKELQDFNNALRRVCMQHRIDYVLLPSDQTLDVALAAYLAARSARMARGGRAR